MLRSIRSRLAIGLLLGSGGLLLGSAGLLWQKISGQLVAEFDSALTAEARALASLVSVNDGGLVFDFADEAMPQFSTRTHSAYFELRRRDGSLVEGSASLRGSSLGPFQMPTEVETRDDVTLPGGSRGRRMTLLVSALRRESDERTEVPEEPGPAEGSAQAYVSVAQDRARLDDFLDRLRMEIGIGVVLVIAATALLVLGTLHWSLLPLARVTREVESLEVNTLARPLAEAGLPSELLPLVHRINELLERLHASFEREREFSANVAHELRTPLAELRSLCDVALAWPPDRETTGEFFVDARAVGLQMEGIVINLLELTRAEGRRGDLCREALALDAVLSEASELYLESVRSRELALEIDCPVDLEVETDRQRLELILSNLISNATAYAPRGAWVRIHALGGEQIIQVSVSNPTTDLAPADMPRLFERFWRKSTARESDGHTGLGLALAAAVARELGATLSSRLADDHVLELRLSLPVQGKSLPIAVGANA